MVKFRGRTQEWGWGRVAGWNATLGAAAWAPLPSITVHPDPTVFLLMSGAAQPYPLFCCRVVLMMAGAAQPDPELPMAGAV